MPERSTIKNGAGPARHPVKMTQTAEFQTRAKVDGAEHSADDAALTCAVLAGHAWAEREIWYRFAPMVFSFLRRTLGARHDPEDLLQEIFLRVFHRLETLKDPTALRSFIYSFAVRVVRDELRRHSIRSRLTRLFLGPASVDSVSHVDFESRELLGRIAQAMDCMNERNRVVFVLRRFEGMELTDIASQLELSLATVKRDLDKANKHLARSIRRDDQLRVGLQANLPKAERERE